MKLGLGTVQFGMDYGISNTIGETDPNEVSRILTYASEQGVHFLDTANTYGNSEETLGKAISAPNLFSIVTKTPPVQSDAVGLKEIRALDDAFHLSLEKLGEQSVYSLMVHHAKDLLLDGGELLFGKMQEYVKSGLIGKIGVSVYGREMLDLILERYPVDLVQVPINVFDQRLLEANYLSEIRKTGIEIHARSVFLQGLLLMEHLPAYFSPIKDHFSTYKTHLNSLGLSLLEGALGFVHSLDEVDVVLCGVNNLQQLKEIMLATNVQINTQDFSCFALQDEAAINPARWS